MADDTLVFTGDVVFDEAAIVRQWEKAQRAIRTKPANISVSDNASRPLGQISRNASELDRSLAAASARVVAFGAATVVFVSIERAISELVKSTVEVENAFARINANLGLSKESLQAYSQSVFDAAKNSGSTFENAAKAAEELSRQNLSTAESQKRLNDALILSRLSGESSVESVKQLTTELAAFSQEGLNSTQIIDKLATVQSQFGVGSKDVSDALGRVGASASQAGVSFDQLVGLITSLQRTTGRSGAAIGDSLNSIFQRTKNPEAIKDLENLGIAVKNTQGQVLPAIDILKNLAAVYPVLSQAQKQTIEQQAGGIFNTNQLKAALSDLNKENGIYAQTQNRVANATGEATRQNEAYNKTLSSQINQAQVSIKQLFANIGSAGIGGLAGGGLKLLNGALDVFNEQKGQESGQNFGQGLVKGIANVLSGPALVGGLVVLTSVIAKVVSGSVQQLQSVLGLNNAAKERAGVETQINSLLSQANVLELAQYTSAKSLLEQKQAILAIDQRITAETEKQVALGAALQGEILGANLRGGPLSGLTNAKSPIKSFAGGYVPAIHQEKSAIHHGVGGASSTARPVVVPNFNFGNGKKGTIVANSDEHIIKNYVKGGDAIFNRDMVHKYGLPKGAQKITAAGGFIPNFSAEFNKYLKDIHPDYIDQFERIEKSDPILGRFLKETTDLKGVDAVREHGQLLNKKSIQVTPAKYGLGTTTYVNLDEEPSEIRKKLTNKFNDFNIKSPFTAAQGYVPSFGVISKKVLGAYTPGRSSTTENGSSLSYNFDKEKRAIDIGFIDSKKKGDAFKLFNRLLDVSKRGDFPITSSSLIAQEEKYNPLDHTNSDNYTKLSALFPQIKYRDTDRAVTSGKARVGGKIFAFDNINHLKEQTNNIDPMAFSEGLGDSLLYKLNTRALASGYIPSFNKDLKAAIEREVLSGVPRNKVYIDKDIRLKSPENPQGLLVANKRDEPLGGAQGVDRVIHSGLDPKKNGAYARGFVPNFAVNDDARRILGLGAETLSGLGGGDARDKLVKSLDVSSINFDTSEEGLKKKITKAVKYALDLSPSDIKGKGESAKAVRQLVEEIVTVRASEFSDLKAKAEVATKTRVDEVTAPKQIPLKIFDSNSRQASPEQIAEFEKNRASTAGGPGPVASDPRFIARKTQREKNELLARDRSDFLTANDDRGRDQATVNISNRLLEGRKITKPQNSLLKNQFTLEGAATASQVLPPGSSSQAIKAFTDNYVKEKLKSLNAGIDRELETNKSLSELSNTNLQGILKTSGNNRSENINVTRSALVQPSVNENGSVNTNAIKSLVGLGKSSTLTDDFEVSVKKLITSGQTLEKAYENASKEFIAAGGTAKQLANAQVKVLNTSIGYEAALNAERQQTIQSKASTDRYQQLKTQFESEGSKLSNRLNPRFDHTTLADDFIKKNNLSEEEGRGIRGRATELQERRSAKINTTTLAASFVLPAVAGFVPDRPGGTVKGVGLGAVQGSAQGAGSLGIFGPEGLIIGAALGGLIGGLSKLTVSAEDLAEGFAKVNEKNQQRTQGLQEFSQVRNGLDDALKQGADSKTINRFQDNFSESFQKLDQNDRKKIISGGASSDVIQEILDAAQKTQVQDQKKTSAGDLLAQSTQRNVFQQAFNLDGGKDRIPDAAKALGQIIPAEIVKGLNLNLLNTVGKSKNATDIGFSNPLNYLKPNFSFKATKALDDITPQVAFVQEQFAKVKDSLPKDTLQKLGKVGGVDVGAINATNFNRYAEILAEAGRIANQTAEDTAKLNKISKEHNDIILAQSQRLQIVDRVQKTSDIYRQGNTERADLGIRAQSQIIGLNSSPQEAITRLAELQISRIEADTDNQKKTSRENLTENILATNNTDPKSDIAAYLRDVVSRGNFKDIQDNPSRFGIQPENKADVNKLIQAQSSNEADLNARRQVEVNNNLAGANIDKQLEKINRIFGAFSNFDSGGASLLATSAYRNPFGGSNAGSRASANNAFVKSQEFLVKEGASESQSDKDIFLQSKANDQKNNILKYSNTTLSSIPGLRPLEDRFGNVDTKATERRLARIGNVDENKVDENGEAITKRQITLSNGKKVDRDINYGLTGFTDQQRAQARTELSALRTQDNFAKNGGKASINGTDSKPLDAIAALKALNDKINADQAAQVAKFTKLLNQGINFKVDGTIKLISTILDPDTEKALTESILAEVQNIVDIKLREKDASDKGNKPAPTSLFKNAYGSSTASPVQ